MASHAAPLQDNLPTRSTNLSTGDDDVIPDDDSSEVTKLFHERLQAWKHACGYLEDYISATEKAHSNQAKDYEKAVLKSVSNPLKEGHHFEQNLGGVAGLFDNIRSNTQGIANSHTETAKTLKGSVLPVFERLHTEIKNKTKELTKGAGKGAKLVDKARQSSQKHIELLGQHTASFDSQGGNVKAGDDPYLLQRQIYHRLNKQVIEENNNRDDMLSVQNNFSTFEAHVVKTFQTGLQQFNQVVANQAEQVRSMYGDVLGTTQRIAPDFEWNGFVRRNNNILIDPTAPKRSVENIAFPNQDHRSTKPLIAGSLERKGKMIKTYSTGFYVVTSAKYLHEFKTDDDFAKDPSPENSLYLPDCLVGAVDGNKFNVRGKDASKGGLAQKMALTHEYAFKAHSPADAVKWRDIIASVAGGSSNETFDNSEPSSPATANKSEITSPVTPATAGTETFPAGAIPAAAPTHAQTAVPTTAVPTAAAPSAADIAAEKEIAHMKATS